MALQPMLPPASSYPPLSAPTNNLAIASVCCGIGGWVLALLLFCFNVTIGLFIALATLGIGSLCLIPLGCLPPLPWLAAVITGHLSLSQIKSTGEGGQSLAITGLVSGYLGLGLLVLSLCGIVALTAFGMAIPVLSQPNR